VNEKMKNNEDNIDENSEYGTLQEQELY